jgi:pimeloyl-ACP methyl ester carboxylesterase
MVSGVPMSALVASVPDPRLVIVALHGGAVTSAYYDYPEHPRLSMLRAGAALGYTVIALDRPGYGASAAHDGPALGTVSRRVDLIFGAIESLLAGRPRGAGVFLVAHSMGCILGVQSAASAAGASLLGLEIAGTGLAPHPEADFMTPLTRSDGPRPGYAGRPRRATLQSAMWAPPELYPPGALEAVTFVHSPHYEGPDIRGWISAFPSLAGSVSVPVHYTLGDHERVWDPSAPAMASVASLFTASPRVSVLLQPEAAHNLSRCRCAAAYHLKVFSFAEECALAREASGATLPQLTSGVPESPSLPTPPPGG